MKVERSGPYMIRVGEGRDEFSFPDPARAGSYVYGAYDYLLRVCPTTKDAMKKLGLMRRALRFLAKRAGGGSNTGGRTTMSESDETLTFAEATTTRKEAP